MLRSIFAFLAALSTMPALAAGAPPARPKLVVAIAVDQFSAALLAQYRERFGGGLHRLTSEGVVFANGFQSHAVTETCPGHSTILTGRHPSATGIIANDWYDVAAAREVYCVEDPAGPVPGRPKAPRGPGNLKVSTLGEWMKAANPASRVFGVSGKDRAAIMMTGHRPDGVFWWDDENGFTTNVPAGTRAAARLAPVEGFNARIWKSWAAAPPAWTVRDKQCLALAGDTRRYGALTVSHTLPPPIGAPGPAGSFDRKEKAFLKWFRASPGFDKVVLDLASRLLDEQRLGRGSAPDLLAVSLSATDYVGHRYGNQGPEMCDQLAQLDAALGAFLGKLAHLGVPVTVVLTADHGSIDAAERVAERGVPAERVRTGTLMKGVVAQVRAEFGLGFDPFLVGDAQLFFDPKFAGSPLRTRIEARTVMLLAALPQVAAVLRKSEVLAASPPRGKPADELTLAERYSESIDRERSGDLIVVPEPFASFGNPSEPGDSIAGHGSPWNYDRRVPILFWWPGAAGFEQPLPVETVDIAPTLAALLGIATPELDGRCLDLDRSARSTCPPR